MKDVATFSGKFCSSQHSNAFCSRASSDSPVARRSPPVPTGRRPEEVVETTRSGERNVTGIHQPSLTPYLPDAGKANGAAIVIAPGAGHSSHRHRQRVTGRVFPSSESSPSTAYDSNNSEFNCPHSANTSSVIGKSNEAACFGNSAGVRLITSPKGTLFVTMLSFAEPRRRKIDSTRLCHQPVVCCNGCSVALWSNENIARGTQLGSRRPVYLVHLS